MELIPLIHQKEDDRFLCEQLEHYEKVKHNLKSVVNELASDEAIFTVDTGMTCVWGARYLQANGKRRLLGSFNHGSMANAMPQAIGAALAYPERQEIGRAHV